MPSAGVTVLWAACAAAVLVAALRFHTAPWYDLGFLVDDYARLGAGLTPHLDYGTSIPQLATVAAWALHPNAADPLFYFNMLGTGLWLANTVLLAAFARRLGLGAATIAACILLWTAAADPAAIPHLYNQLGAALFALTALAALAYRTHGTLARAFALGFLAAAALFVKPPIGLAAGAVAAAAVALRLASRGMTANGAREAGLAMLAGGLGAAGASACALLILLRGDMAALGDGGAVAEVLRQTFLDAGTAKGSALIALRWIPRIKPGPLADAPAWQIAVSFTACALLIAVLLRMARCRTAAAGTASDARIAIAFAATLAAGTIAAHTLAIPAMTAFDAIAGAMYIGRTLNNLLYLACLAVAAAAAFRMRRDEGATAFAVVAVVAALFAIGASSIDYPPYAGPVLLPALAALLTGLLGPARTRVVVIAVASLYLVCGLTFDSYRSNGYRAGCGLPQRGGTVSALSGSAPQCARFDAVAAATRPVAADDHVAWLTFPSGFAALIGRPAPGLGGIYWDTYAARVETRLRAAWTAHPPDYVVIEHDLRFPPGSALVPGGPLRAWVLSRYQAAGTTNGPYLLLKRR